MSTANRSTSPTSNWSSIYSAYPDADYDAEYMAQKRDFHLLFGVIQVLVVALFLVLHLLMLRYLISRVNLSPATIGYRLMIVMAVSDEIQLIIHFYTGIVMICKQRIRPKPTEIAGAILAAGWYVMMSSMFTVTLYRFIVILFPSISHIVTNNRAFIIFLSGNICVFLSVLVVHLIGLNAQYLTEYGWLYADDHLLSGFFNNIDDYGTPLLTIVCLAMYIAIFTFLMRNKKVNRENDIRWALQTFCFCLYTIFVSIEWTWIYEMIPETYTNLFVENFLWPLWNGANVVFFFIFQKNVLFGDKRVIVLLPVTGQKFPPSRRNSCMPPGTHNDTQETRLSM